MAVRVTAAGSGGQVGELALNRPQGLPAPADPVALAEQVAGWPQLLLLLDYDGTLSELAPTPEAAVTVPGAIPALERLVQRARVAVAVVSGRPVTQLAERLPVPGLWLVGEHGAVARRPDGGMERLVDPAALSVVLADLERRTRLVLGNRPGWRVERKGVGLALHYRQVPPREAQHLLPRIQDLWLRPMLAAGLRLLPGNKVLEVRPRNIDKGRATEWLLGQLPGTRPLFLGDDTTDEDGFAAAERRGGAGVLVAPVPRSSRASLRISSPGEVVQFLTALADVRS